MMTIKFAKYAFKDLLKQLHYSGINEITVTKEDNDLEVVISDKYLEPHKIESTNNTQRDCIDKIWSPSSDIDPKNGFVEFN